MKKNCPSVHWLKELLRCYRLVHSVRMVEGAVRIRLELEVSIPLAVDDSWKVENSGSNENP